MNRPSLVHLAMIAVVCALGAQPAAAQDTRAESVSQERAAKAQTAPAVHEPACFNARSRGSATR